MIEFFRFGGEHQPLACFIVKISLISRTIIAISSKRISNTNNGVEFILEKSQSLVSEETRLEYLISYIINKYIL